MDFGYLPDLTNVDFALPPDHPDTLRQLHFNAREVSVPPQVYIGCPVWQNKPWVGSYYPAGAREKDFLYYYARQFNTIELNTTYYRIPDEATITRWREAVTPEFKFCPKFPQIISHQKQLQLAEAETELFSSNILGLGENLGICFLQLPPVFNPEKLPILEKFLLSLPEALPLAVEFRHPGWFSDFEAGREAFALLEACGVGTVMSDTAGRRDALHMRPTTPVLFLRFNGYNLHPSDFTRTAAWVHRLKSWFQEGLQTAYFFVHQHHIQNAPVLVHYLQDQLDKVCQIDLHHLCQPFAQEIQGKLF